MSTAASRMPSDFLYEASREIRPPPYYRQAGQSLQRKTQKPDHSRGSKRRRNRGECNAKRSTPRLDAQINASSGDASSDDDEGPAIAAFFASQLSAAAVKRRQQYSCEQCGKTGHNIKTCKNVNKEYEEAGVPIKPGKYLVGECPFTICGIRSGYEGAVDS
ncbi:hypothetical protein PPTG_06118 [Phytophthora nicotianae INRA-310]|uniref:CCHC-type domain-containing protein n=1 Tax=Phytophthora nicotianae (strain INRA-310) TaxID=761204 RepID=W2QVD8_PHYN3|nr:hypothetical protein PPTG_06118 [Phytophthora nicotianae INRA-310]ETN17093.1 hypothetical protein PPTG_06118 [Phytophthora nicotianae INRA-310]